jgi:discoidin domain receptor family protein 2
MEARVFFSLDGVRYQQTPLYFSLDTNGEDDWYRDPTPLKDLGGAALNVTIPLQNRVGRFVRLEMEFASKWLLLSEVYFDSGEYSRLFGLNSYVHKKASVDWIAATSLSV